MRTIAITNQKGGCGKTTTAVNLSAALAAKGYRVLLVDLDPQGHATLAMDKQPENLAATIYDVIVSRAAISDLILATPMQNLSVVGSNVLLSGAEAYLATAASREYILFNALTSLWHQFDFCVIDCSPSLCVLTLNSLVAATDVIIPVQTHYYAIEGLKQVLETIDVVKERFNPKMRIAGVLLTLAEKRTRLAMQVEQQLREYFGPLIFNTVIHRNIRLAEAPSAGQSIITYDPKGQGALEHIQLAEELCYEKIRITQTDFVHI